MASSLIACTALLKRELIIAFRHRAEWLNPLLFFVLVVCLFPLSLNAQPTLLQVIAPGVIWVAALLAILLSLDKLFRQDMLEGFLNHLVLNNHSLILLVITKIFAHWAFTCLPLILLTPLLALIMHLNSAATIALCITLLLGTPVLILIGAIFAAITLSLRNNNLLLPLLTLPFYIPILIFGAGSVSLAISGLSIHGQIAILAAILLITIPLAAWSVASALQIVIE